MEFIFSPEEKKLEGSTTINSNTFPTGGSLYHLIPLEISGVEKGTHFPSLKSKILPSTILITLSELSLYFLLLFYFSLSKVYSKYSLRKSRCRNTLH